MAAVGHQLTIDFKGTLDGVAFEGGSAEGVELELGSGRMIPGFEDQLIGARSGESRDLQVSFPAEYGNAALAGQAAVFATRGNAEWIDRLNAAGVPCGPIWRVDELFADPQAEYLGLSVPVDHPRLGRRGLLDQMVTLTRTPAEIRSPTPELGAHTDEVLAGLGYDASARDALRARGVI